VQIAISAARAFAPFPARRSARRSAPSPWVGWRRRRSRASSRARSRSTRWP